MRLTYEDVKTVAERQLAAADGLEQVTCRTLIAELGGSMSTVTPLLREWKRQKQGAIPPVLVKAWRTMEEGIDEQTAQVLKEADQAVEEAKTKVTEKELALVNVNQAYRELQEVERHLRLQVADQQQELAGIRATAAEREKALGQKLEDQRAAVDRREGELQEQLTLIERQMQDLAERLASAQQRLIVDQQEEQSLQHQLEQAQHQADHQQHLAQAAAAREAEQGRQAKDREATLHQQWDQALHLVEKQDLALKEAGEREAELRQQLEAAQNLRAEGELAKMKDQLAQQIGLMKAAITTRLDAVETTLQGLQRPLDDEPSGAEASASVAEAPPGNGKKTRRKGAQTGKSI